MRSHLLQYTWKKATNDYSYAYILITNQYSIERIAEEQKQGKKIVLWGWRPESIGAIYALAEHGITIDYACDIYQKDDIYIYI